jgi:hypothetical protein
MHETRWRSSAFDGYAVKIQKERDALKQGI